MESLGGSIFLVFVGNPHPLIYILDENLVWKFSFPTHPRNYIPKNKQNPHNPQKLAPMKLNDSTEYAHMYTL